MPGASIKHEKSNEDLRRQGDSKQKLTPSCGTREQVPLPQHRERW
ncbi:hypothetical protein HNP02_005834 [Mycobacterium sp. AZCC_0083]|nr:hypothetical protein [Mycobacterium sp. AZCC_0083]